MVMKPERYIHLFPIGKDEYTLVQACGLVVWRLLTRKRVKKFPSPPTPLPQGARGEESTYPRKTHLKSSVKRAPLPCINRPTRKMRPPRRRTPRSSPAPRACPRAAATTECPAASPGKMVSVLFIQPKI